MGVLGDELRSLDERVEAASERVKSARNAARPPQRAARLEEVVGKLSRPWKGEGKYGRITARDLANPVRREEVRRLGRGVAQRLLHEPDLVLIPIDPQRPQRGLVIHSTAPDDDLADAEVALRDAESKRKTFLSENEDALREEEVADEREAFKSAVDAGDVEAVKELVG